MKRYDEVDDCAGMRISPDGAWVPHEDVLDLQASHRREIRALKDQQIKLECIILGYRRRFDDMRAILKTEPE